MKVILSRKGFDSKNGGNPSPILPDGTLLSLPIPDSLHSVGNSNYKEYSELYFEGRSYAETINQLNPKFNDTYCHLDPDIRREICKRDKNWTAVFGQSNAAQTHLIKHGVQEDDLFLFYGWFKQTEYGEDGRLTYVADAPDLHIVYGYLQVGKMITDDKEIKKYNWHPHASDGYINNCLYIARDTCSWDSSKQGYGVLSNRKDRVLTKDGMSRRYWNLPFGNIPISWNPDNVAWANWKKDGSGYFQSSDIGQEFVISDNTEVEDWAKSLLAD